MRKWRRIGIVICLRVDVVEGVELGLEDFKEFWVSYFLGFSYYLGVYLFLVRVDELVNLGRNIFYFVILNVLVDR